MVTTSTEREAGIKDDKLAINEATAVQVLISRFIEQKESRADCQKYY